MRFFGKRRAEARAGPRRSSAAVALGLGLEVVTAQAFVAQMEGKRSGRALCACDSAANGASLQARRMAAMAPVRTQVYRTAVNTPASCGQRCRSALSGGGLPDAIRRRWSSRGWTACRGRNPVRHADAASGSGKSATFGFWITPYHRQRRAARASWCGTIWINPGQSRRGLRLNGGGDSCRAAAKRPTMPSRSMATRRTWLASTMLSGIFAKSARPARPTPEPDAPWPCWRRSCWRTARSALGTLPQRRSRLRTTDVAY